MLDLHSLAALSFTTPEEIQEYQLAELKKAIRYTSENSPFFKSVFQKKGLHFSDFQSFDDFRKIPVSSKLDMQNIDSDFCCVKPNQIIDYVTTSGTLGKPITIFQSEKDLKRLALNEASSFLTAGCSSEDIFQLTTTIDRRFMAGLAYYEGARLLKAGIVRVGPGAPELQWETIHRIMPSVIIGVPSFLIKLLDFALQNGINPNQTSVKKAICIGEGIRKNDLSYNTLGKQILERWNIQIYSTYASTEMATAYTECEHQCGGHENPGLIYSEILDEEQNPVKDGEAGELTFTNFGVEAMPFLRFRTGDIVRAFREKCACGRNSLRIGPVEGRLNQMIKFKGTTVFPQAILETLNEITAIKDYRIELKKTEFGTDSITVFYASAHEESQEFKAELEACFRARLRVVPEIIFEKIELIAQKKYPEGTRKPLAIIDKR